MQPPAQTCGVKGIALSYRKTPGNPLRAQKETCLLQKQSHRDSGLQSSTLYPVLLVAVFMVAGSQVQELRGEKLHYLILLKTCVSVAERAPVELESIEGGKSQRGEFPNASTFLRGMSPL